MKKNKELVLTKCPLCKKLISSDAMFCPSCGHVLQKDHSSIISSVITIIVIILVVVFLFVNKTTVLDVTHTVLNNNRGVDTPKDAAEKYVKALEFSDVDQITVILDNSIQYNNFLSNLNDTFNYLNNSSDYKNLNWDGYETEVSSTYEYGEYTCCDVTIKIYPEGILFDNSKIFSPYISTLNLHKATTPQGNKWFVGIPEMKE